MYIPATQLDMIQKYAGADAKKPQSEQAGNGSSGRRPKVRSKERSGQIAKDLVELYAKRQQTDGYVYGEDTVWQREFEEMFPFEETEDQLQAIEAVKSRYGKHQDHGSSDLRGCRATERRRLPSVQPLRRCRKTNRWSIWCRPRFWHSSITIPSYSG